MALPTYREDELIDSIVIDKEGYICGYIANFQIESTQILINLYHYDTQTIEAPDEDELVRRLLEVIPKKGVFNRGSGNGGLYALVREILRLPNNEPVTLEHLIEYAKARRIEIPYKTHDVQTKIDKGSINWSDVNKIGFSDLGKCVILNKAVETKKRKIKNSLNKKVSYKSTEHLAGKKVIDSEANIVGTASRFLIGTPPGLLINIERVAKKRNNDIEALKRALIPSRFKDERELLEKVRKDLKLKVLNDYSTRALAVWAQKNNIDVRESTSVQREAVMDISVSWDKIDVIGDVVMLRDPLEALL